MIIINIKAVKCINEVRKCSTRILWCVQIFLYSFRDTEMFYPATAECSPTRLERTSAFQILETYNKNIKVYMPALHADSFLCVCCDFSVLLEDCSATSTTRVYSHSSRSTLHTARRRSPKPSPNPSTPTGESPCTSIIHCKQLWWSVDVHSQVFPHVAW